MSSPVLEVQDLCVEVEGRSVDIVDDISFTIDAGEVLGLVGESGSGKSTIGLAVLGHTRRGATITSGAIRIEGRDILRLSERQRRALRGRTVSYVPQDPASALNPGLRIRTQLEEVLEAHGWGESRLARAARLAEMLDEVLLPKDDKFLGRYPHQLSGGQQQRVGLAMAFACRPRVIVLDEPTTGLDVTTQRHVLATVRDLCTAHGVAALYVSHDLAVVASLADRVAVMYAGRIVERGSAEQIYRSPQHPYTWGLLKSIPRLDVPRGEELIPIAGRPPSLINRPSGCFFHPRCPFAFAEQRRRDPHLEPVPDRWDTRSPACWSRRHGQRSGKG